MELEPMIVDRKTEKEINRAINWLTNQVDDGCAARDAMSYTQSVMNLVRTLESFSSIKLHEAQIAEIEKTINS